MSGRFNRRPRPFVPRRAPRPRGGAQRANVPTHLGFPARNSLTGAQLLELNYKERRTLRKKRVITARHERRAIHAEIMRQAEAKRRKEQADG
jgi:hypothetical protein